MKKIERQEYRLYARTTRELKKVHDELFATFTLDEEIEEAVEHVLVKENTAILFYENEVYTISTNNNCEAVVNCLEKKVGAFTRLVTQEKHLLCAIDENCALDFLYTNFFTRLSCTYVENSTIANSRVHDCSVVNSELADTCNCHESRITSSTLTHASIFSSKIDSCDLFHTLTTNCKLFKAKLIHCNVIDVQLYHPIKMSYEVFSQRASRLMWKNAFVFIFYFDEFERAIRVRKEKVSYTLQPLEAYSLFDLDIEYSLLQSLTGGKYDSEVEMLLQLVER